MPKQPPSIPNRNLLKERLVTKEGLQFLPQRGSLSRCVLRYRDFINAYHSNNNSSSNEGGQEQDNTSSSALVLQNAQNELITELKLHDLEMRKVSLTSKAILTELQHYESLSKETSESIDQIRNDINQLKEKLIFEQKVRKHREEYEELAKQANRRPAVSVTKRKLDNVNKDIEDLLVKKQRNDEMITLKRKQFQSLMQNIFDLKNSLDEDEVRKDIIENCRKEADPSTDEGDVTKDESYDVKET